ncbi:MAG: hypothetical protein II698_01170, partial [Ruminococcus sp.]|nr:hypothetical protein [Ruminococcus sp.]
MTTMTTIDIIGFSVLAAITITMLFGILLTVFIPALDRWSKRYFTAIFSLMFLLSVCCYLALFFWYDPTKAAESRITYLLEDLLLVTPIFMPTLFLLHYSGEKIVSSVLFRLVTLVLGVYCILVAVSQFTD